MKKIILFLMAVIFLTSCPEIRKYDTGYFQEDVVNFSDDKCPFVNGKLLVFASNRPGGYGGFDLYYSLFRDSTWSKPVNFWEKINSAYDEYRPVTVHHNEFINNLMVFSSNRPGG